LKQGFSAPKTASG